MLRNGGEVVLEGAVPGLGGQHVFSQRVGEGVLPGEQPFGHKGTRFIRGQGGKGQSCALVHHGDLLAGGRFFTVAHAAIVVFIQPEAPADGGGGYAAQQLIFVTVAHGHGQGNGLLAAAGRQGQGKGGLTGEHQPVGEGYAQRIGIGVKLPQDECTVRTGGAGDFLQIPAAGRQGQGYAGHGRVSGVQGAAAVLVGERGAADGAQGQAAHQGHAYFLPGGKVEPFAGAHVAFSSKGIAAALHGREHGLAGELIAHIIASGHHRVKQVRAGFVQRGLKNGAAFTHQLHHGPRKPGFAFVLQAIIVAVRKDAALYRARENHARVHLLAVLTQGQEEGLGLSSTTGEVHHDILLPQAGEGIAALGLHGQLIGSGGEILKGIHALVAGFYLVHFVAFRVQQRDGQAGHHLFPFVHGGGEVIVQVAGTGDGTGINGAHHHLLVFAQGQGQRIDAVFPATGAGLEPVAGDGGVHRGGEGGAVVGQDYPQAVVIGPQGRETEAAILGGEGGAHQIAIGLVDFHIHARKGGFSCVIQAIVVGVQEGHAFHGRFPHHAHVLQVQGFTCLQVNALAGRAAAFGGDDGAPLSAGGTVTGEHPPLRAGEGELVVSGTHLVQGVDAIRAGLRGIDLLLILFIDEGNGDVGHYAFALVPNAVGVFIHPNDAGYNGHGVYANAHLGGGLMGHGELLAHLHQLRTHFHDAGGGADLLALLAKAVPLGQRCPQLVGARGQGGENGLALLIGAQGGNPHFLIFQHANGF